MIPRTDRLCCPGRCSYAARLGPFVYQGWRAAVSASWQNAFLGTVTPPDIGLPAGGPTPKPGTTVTRSPRRATCLAIRSEHHNSNTTHDVTRRAPSQQVALFRYQLICPALDPGLRRRLGCGWYERSPPAAMPSRSAVSTPTPATLWTSGSGVTGPAGSTPWHRRYVSLAPGSTRPCWSWRWR